MLILTRRTDQDILIGDDIIIKVIRIERDRVRLGIIAPSHKLVDRAEVRRQRIEKQRLQQQQQQQQQQQPAEVMRPW